MAKAASPQVLSFGASLRLCGRDLLFCEHSASFRAIGFHLRLERLEAVELRLRAEEAVEGDLDLLAVKVARELEEIGLEQLLGRVELRPHAEVGGALQHAPVGQPP